MTINTIQALLDDIQLLDGDQYALVEGVRSLVKTLVPLVSEEVKYGGILFSSGVQFCGVFAYKNHVSVEFSRGAKIRDTFGYLEGSGKGRRHLKLHSVKEIEAKNVAGYIPLGLAAAKSGAAHRPIPKR